MTNKAREVLVCVGGETTIEVCLQTQTLTPTSCCSRLKKDWFGYYNRAMLGGLNSGTGKQSLAVADTNEDVKKHTVHRNTLKWCSGSSPDTSKCITRSVYFPLCMFKGYRLIMRSHTLLWIFEVHNASTLINFVKMPL